MISRLHRLRQVALLVFVALMTPVAHGDDIGELLRPADVRSVIISPDGRHLAMVRSDAQKDTLVIFGRPAMTVVTGVASSAGQRFQTITWANNVTVLIEPAADVGAAEQPIPTGALLALGVDGSRKRLLPANPKAVRLPTAMISVLPNDLANVLIAAHGACEGESCTEAEKALRRPMKLNLETGEKTFVAPALPVPAYYVSDPGGNRMLAAGRTADGRVEIYRLAGGVWTPLSSFDPATDLGTVPLTVDRAGTVFALANKVGTAGLYRWNLDSGETDEIYRGAGSDIDRVIMSYGGRRLLAVRSDPGYASWHYLDAEHPFTRIHTALRAAFPDSDVDVTSFTAEGSEAVIRVYSDRNSGDFYSVSLATGESTLLATSRPWLPAESLAKVEPMELTSRDMFTLRGYVTTPSSAGPHPMVVWIHDKPTTTRAIWELNAEVQMLARGGFAVLQINYRGSGGLGQWYTASGAERDGRAVQRDIADATRWAIDSGIANEGQICVYGRGYGAFAAVKAMATNIGLFQCAVAIDGFYDLASPFSVSEDPTLTPQNLLAFPSMLDLTDVRRSPVNRVFNIEGSVLLVGESDQTITMRDALEETEKSVVWLAPENEQSEYAGILTYLEAELSAKQATGADPAGFGATLTARQAREFQRIREEMRAATKALGSRRAVTATAVRREVQRIIEGYDADVRSIVTDDQWALYDDFKDGLAQELESELDIVRLQ